MHFADLLEEAIDRVGSPVCVGLDPVLESLPPILRAAHHEPLGAIAEFGAGVLRAVQGVVPAVKLQSACYERYGARGYAVLEEHAALARTLGFVVVLDAKRGDIGVSASHYAVGVKRLQAHAVTLSGYLGPSSLVPFLEEGLGAFVLVRTSNPDSDVVQRAGLGDGRTVAEMMANLVQELGATRIGRRGLSSVGAVVGATKSADGPALRARMPDQIFLVPGLGAQGGTAADVRALCRSDGRGVLVSASRSVLYGAGEDWKSGVAQGASAFAAEVRRAIH